MSSQPTEPGWYWAGFAGADDPSRWTPVEVCFVYEHEKDRRELGDHRLWLVKDWRFVDDSGIEWGPKITPPDDLWGRVPTEPCECGGRGYVPAEAITGEW